MSKVKLNTKLVEAFAGTYLSPRYDNPRPTPDFHRECWELYTSDIKQAGAVAPRGHAKSTALTFDYTLAAACFRTADYIIIIGSTEAKASEQLSNLSDELHDNEDLRRDFGIAGFETDQKTDLIVACEDGHRFRLIARGAEQKIRGAMWKGKRPNLIVCDDMEDDEQVESKERRQKFRRWFFRAAKQSLSRSGKIRVHGTILHDDSLLSRLRKNKAWNFLFYKAHTSYNDFTDILWPEQWSQDELIEVRTEFEEDGDAGGYSQEYLNEPRDNEDAYLRPEQFRPMTEEDFERPKIYYAGADFAVSEKQSADRTSFTAVGVDAENISHIEGHIADRWSTADWVEELFLFHQRWEPEIFFVEDGVIWKSIYPMIITEMQRRNVWINFVPINPVKDKPTRGRPFQKRMKVGACRFDKDASWYPAYEDELLKFTNGKQAAHDDQFDSTATAFLGIERQPDVEQDDFIDEDELEIMQHNRYIHTRRETATGYG